MKEIAENFGDDYEVAHSYMDDLLVEFLRSLGYEECCEIFEQQEKFYA